MKGRSKAARTRFGIALLAAASAGCTVLTPLDDLSGDGGAGGASNGTGGIGGAECEAPRVSCGGECVDVTSSTQHCGACDAACAFDNAEASCTAGACVMGDCLGDYDDCDDDDDTGCEVDTATEPDHCGGCGTVCPASEPNTAATCESSECSTECAVGFGDCNGVLADGCETGTVDSPDHCGSCDHGCAGGDCADSTCQPVLIASGISSLGGIAIDATHVYWTSKVPAPNGAVFKAPRDPAQGSPVAILTGLDEPGGVEVDSTNIYVVEGVQPGQSTGRILKGLKSDGTPGPDLVSGFNALGALAIDAQFAYYAAASGVFRVPLAGGSPTQLTTGGSPIVLDVDDTSLYWLGSNQGAVIQQSKSQLDADVVMFSSPGTFAFSLEVEDDFVFWGNALGTVITGSPTDQPAPMDLFTGSGFHILQLSVDATHVYFTEQGTTDVRRVPRAGGAAEVVASPPAEPTLPVGDAVALFWLDVSGSIMKVAK